MTEQLSDEDKEKMKEVFNETPEEAIKRQTFWQKQPKKEYTAWPNNKGGKDV